jgi:hypothetical protein
MLKAVTTGSLTIADGTTGNAGSVAKLFSAAADRTATGSSIVILYSVSLKKITGGDLNVAGAIIKVGGTSSQFLKADGSVDSSTYLTGTGATGKVAYWDGTNTLTNNTLFSYSEHLGDAQLNIGTLFIQSNSQDIDSISGNDLQINATTIVIGANVLDTTEWAFLDGIDQALKTTSDPTFGHLHLNNATNQIVLDADGTYTGTLTMASLTTASKVWTLPNLTGTIPLGTGTSGYVAYWNGTNSLTSNSNFNASTGPGGAFVVNVGTIGLDSEAGMDYISGTNLDIGGVISIENFADGATILDAENYMLQDSGSVYSVDFGSRILYASNGTTAMINWATSGTVALGTNALTTTGAITANTLNAIAAGGLTLGTDAATNIAGFIKLWGAGANNYYTSFITGTQTATATYTLPTAMPVSNKFLQSTSTGVLSWETVSGGYTNLTSFVDQTAWRIFYSNTNGDVTELALGADGTYLKSNGATSAPTFATPSGTVGKWTVETKTDDYPVLTTDVAKTLVMNNAGTKTFSLPSVAAGDVGTWYTFVKIGAGKVIIDAADSDTIADSGAGDTIYNDQTLEIYATITLELVSETQWAIIGASGTFVTTD